MRDREEHQKHGPGLSRRDFLKGSGAIAAATAIQGSAALGDDQAADSPVVGPGAVPITLDINGEKRQLKLQPRVTLLDALRNDLDLTGAKKACDDCSCGSCTVLLDGKPAYACSVLAVAAQGMSIKTVESLGGEHVDPVPTAFVHHDGMQCGFCTPGFVVAVRGFLDKNPNASLDDIRAGLNGNICRCGTYMGVTAAAYEVAKKGGGNG
jgi:xanthine dehydrogenase YagT iron-sulfur-binding subunit